MERAWLPTMIAVCSAAGPAVHAAVQPDLWVQHAVGQQGGRGRHAGGLQHHHLLAREPARDKEASRGRGALFIN